MLQIPFISIKKNVGRNITIPLIKLSLITSECLQNGEQNQKILALGPEKNFLEYFVLCYAKIINIQGFVSYQIIIKTNKHVYSFKCPKWELGII